MQQFTDEALDQKIRSFMVSRIEKYPELADVKSTTTEKSSKKRSVLEAFFPVQLHIQL